MMGKNPNEKPFWIKFEMDKWEGGVDGLTPEAEYLFFRICRKVWSTGKPVFLEQLGPISRGIKDANVYLEELVRTGKVIVDSGLIKNAKARRAHFEARKTMIKNQKRTRKATEARKKQPLTPRKEKEKTADRDDQRNEDTVQYSTEEKKNSSNSSLTDGKNSNSSKNALGNEFNNGEYGDKVGTLKSATYEKARNLAPGYDIYYIEDRWRSSGFAAKAKKPDAAFLGFLRTHVKENPL